jgi:hypothetical protein
MKPSPQLVLLAIMTVASLSYAADDGEIVSLSTSPWKVAPEIDVRETGEQLSMPGYNSDKWLAAHVPGTAFVDYVIAGKEPEPNFGLNVQNVKKEKYNQDYWYRTEFTVPTEYLQSGRVWLNLDGVHRDGDVFINGTKLGTMKGFFQRGRFDVTGLVRKNCKNSVAVLAHIMNVKGPNAANDKHTGNYSSPSLLCSRGWDWMPPVPGLNTGILKDVYLTHTGEVSIIDPWIRSYLPKNEVADLTVQAELSNASTAPVAGELLGVVTPGNLAFRKSVTLKPGEKQTVTITAADALALHILNPKLWWPNGYGDPNLYTCRLEFRAGEKVSDQKTVTFGIKKYTYEVKNNVLNFFINGTRLFLKGGSWGLPEYLLRNRTAADYEIRVRLQKEQNFNIIRNWLGSVPDKAFYEACDRNGIMVWDEFWLHNGNADGEPGDIAEYHANVIEKVKQVRNHPCIAIWVAMNEGTPPPPVNEPNEQIIKEYDGDERKYLPCSIKGNLTDSGPWQCFEQTAYFRGTFNNSGHEKPMTKDTYGMKSELGTAVFTSFDSFKRFIPKDEWWPRSQTVWNRHYFGPKARNAGPDKYWYMLGMHYGEPSDIEDLCLKAQLFNLETMKAMFEGCVDRSDTIASGLIIWMSHPAYPCFVWQTYDYYYDTTGAYWGAKSACEPFHIYWNCGDDRIRVANTTRTPLNGLKADLWIYNLDGTEKAHQTAKVDAPIDAVADCFKLNPPADLSSTHFIKLRLTDSAGKVVSENFYWRGTTPLDYFGLSSIKPVKLAVTTPTSEALPGGMTRMTLDITNPVNSGAVAFSIRPKPVKPGTDEQVLPVYMNDGYFSLVPGETKHVTIEYNPVNADGKTPKVEVECWNNYPHPMPTKPVPTPEPVKKPAPAKK